MGCALSRVVVGGVGVFGLSKLSVLLSTEVPIERPIYQYHKQGTEYYWYIHEEYAPLSWEALLSIPLLCTGPPSRTASAISLGMKSSLPNSALASTANAPVGSIVTSSSVRLAWAI